MASATGSAPMRMDSQGNTVMTVAIVFGVLTIFVMTFRLTARLCILKSFGVDDALMCGGALLSWAFIVATILAVKHGLGSHIEVVMAKNEITSYSQIVWVSSIFYNACLTFIKTSVLALYARLGDRTLRWMALVMMGIVACQGTANVLVCIFQCNPIPAAWNLAITNKKCVNINAFYLANAATNIATDLMTYCLPWNTVRKLQVPRRQKMAVGVMLGLGLFACVSSIIRITYIPQMLQSTDPTYVISGAMYWSVIETNIGILAASIPSFKALVKRFLPKILGDYSGSGSGPYSRQRSGGYVRSHERKGGSTGFSKLSGNTAVNSYGSSGNPHDDYLDSGKAGAQKDQSSTTVIPLDLYKETQGRPLASPGTRTSIGRTISDISAEEDHHSPTTPPRTSHSSEERIIIQQNSAPSLGRLGGDAGTASSARGGITRTTEITSTYGPRAQGGGRQVHGGGVVSCTAQAGRGDG